MWNRLGYSKRTIASLIDSGAALGCERFIIVDNCSTEEGITEFLNDMYTNIIGISGKVFILRRAKNDGWAAAVNDAINLSRSEYVLLCNNDAEFKPDFMEKAFDVIAKTEAATARIGILGLWRHTSHGDAKGGIKTSIFVETDDSPGVAWLLWKPAMIEIGMLTEKGPAMKKGGNGEDTDYVLKMKAAGYLVGSPVPDLAVHIDGY